MKPLKLIIFTTFLIATYFTNAQIIADTTKLAYYNRDTLQFFEKIYHANSSKYINKPIAALLDKLEFQPQIMLFGFSKRIDSVYSVDFEFLSPTKSDDIFYSKAKGSYYCLNIRISPPIPMDSAVQILRSTRYLDERLEYQNLRAFVNNLSIKEFSFFRMVYD